MNAGIDNGGNTMSFWRLLKHYSILASPRYSATMCRDAATSNRRMPAPVCLMTSRPTFRTVPR